MSKAEGPRPHSLWRHVKGGLYLVLGTAQCSTNGNEQEQSVIYWSFKYQALRYRKLEEFLDGRFKELDVQEVEQRL